MKYGSGAEFTVQHQREYRIKYIILVVTNVRLRISIGSVELMPKTNTIDSNRFQNKHKQQ